MIIKDLLHQIRCFFMCTVPKMFDLNYEKVSTLMSASCSLKLGLWFMTSDRIVYWIHHRVAAVWRVWRVWSSPRWLRPVNAPSYHPASVWRQQAPPTLILDTVVRRLLASCPTLEPVLHSRECSHESWVRSAVPHDVTSHVVCDPSSGTFVQCLGQTFFGCH